MKIKNIFLLSITFLVLFVESSVSFAGDLQDGVDAALKEDYITAFNLWKPLADQGHRDAQYNLGVMYANGRGVTQDDKESVKWYRLSADQGHERSQYNLGVMYFNGQGVPKDYKESVKWSRLSAEQGYAKAQYNLGVVYSNGRGVTKDYKEALKWFRLSADQGHVDAQYNLGLMYVSGRGVTKDYSLSYMWFNLSSSNGDKLSIKYKDIIEKEMSPSQIEKAQEMARNWKPKTK